MTSSIMRVCLSLWVGVVALAGTGTGVAGSDAQALQTFFAMPLAENELGYMRLGYCSEVIIRSAGKTVLFDPGSLDKEVLAVLIEQRVDLVIYTHAHYDHYSDDTAIKLWVNGQPFFAVEAQLAGYLEKKLPGKKLIIVEAGQTYSAGSIAIDTLEGDHIGPITLFRVTLNGMKIFHGGDSAYVPLQALAAQLAFVPTGSPSPTCSPNDASLMVADVQPQVAVPMHGGDGQHRRFKELVDAKRTDVRVVIAVPFEGHKVSLQ